MVNENTDGDSRFGHIGKQVEWVRGQIVPLKRPDHLPLPSWLVKVVNHLISLMVVNKMISRVIKTCLCGKYSVISGQNMVLLSARFTSGRESGP